ncbi:MULTISPECIES: Csu type fimbrial protein [Methylococcus]|jgi:spore coat protein U-like protein|uniref:Lipoprotein n=2 Tax=Methylococcus capsulatus TaxID=414 RepID=A0AA35UB03_METCP|nr:spore coat U domain-containing protein [Methylococcus capsulatus]AAU90451.1 putative lipoprotein [Methylococcus capsulatus str. Bath]QXP89756.1 spore coat U domain-containing protein [Methylococcus capsulatus]CAI8774252.1 putative lipoprotein [Methylococcus capsulatus]
MKHDIRASRQWRAAAMTFSLLACPKISDADPYQCDIGNISVPHAVYDPTDSNPNSSGVGTVGITCHLKNAKQTQQVQYTIALSRGSSGSYNPRRMSGGRGSLGYNLYLDAARVTIWGDGSGGTFPLRGTLLLNPTTPVQQVIHNIYGLIPPLQDVYAGTYTDTVTITLTY